MLRKHLARQRQHLFACDGPGEEAHELASVIVRNFAGFAQYQNRQRGHPEMQLGHKRRTADALHVLSRDDQTKTPCELGLLHQAESLGGIAHTLHIVESPFQDRLPMKRLEGIVVHQ
jgi:hypothetical protein